MKKVLTVMVLSCFLVSNCLPLFASEGDSQQLTSAIEQTKVTLGIDTSIWDEFDYSSYYNEQGTRWRLNWHNTDATGSSLMVEIDEQGNIYSYRQNQTDRDYYGEKYVPLAALQQSTAQAHADKFLHQVAPAIASQMQLDEQSKGQSSADSFSFTYQQMLEGIAIQDATITINVDKSNGAIASYYASDCMDFTQQVYPDPTKAISMAKALTALEKEIGLELIYRTAYDYDTGKTSVFPAYQLRKNNRVIDAMSGKAMNPSANVNPLARASNESAADAGGALNKGMTPQEQKAVTATQSLYTKEQAFAALQAVSDVDLSTYTITHSALNKSDGDNGYVWSLSLGSAEGSEKYGSINGTVDAQNGVVLSYNNYSEQEPLAQPVSASKGEQIIQAFLEKNAAEYLKQCKIVTEDEEMTEEQTVIYQLYARQVNGIAYPDNGLSMSYDLKTGKILSYHLNWTDGLAFPSIAKAKTPTQISSLMAKNANYQLTYLNDPQTNYLVYTFQEQGFLIVDPFTGERLDWQGKPYQKSSNLPQYQWQGSQSSKTLAQRLLENGVYLDESQINGTAAMTQKQLLTLLHRSRYPYTDMDEETLYRQMAQQKVLFSDEKAPEKSLTRQECAKYVVRFLGYDKLAIQNGIFAYPYTDTVDKSYQGYVAIAAGLQLLKANEQKQILPTAAMTLDDGFAMIYTMVN